MLKSLVLLVILSFTFSAFAAERVILLAPAAADIMHKLGCEDKIVGKTKSVEEFPNAMKVGSHIRPNIELIMSLKPDVIVIPSNRFFTEAMVKEVGVPVFQYNPLTLDEILVGIAEVGELMGKQSEAKELNAQLRSMMKHLKGINDAPVVVFESMQMPYTVAGSKSIVADIIKRAGGKFAIEDERKIVRFNMESAVAINPDIYIYQVGPMNKNPEPPAEGAVFRTMKAKYLKGDERKFSRANSISFENVIMLNELFSEFKRDK